MVNHINVADEKGRVYCCLRNRVVRLDDSHKAEFCGGCRMYNGDAGGRGVECLWDDIREQSGVEQVLAEDPQSEWISNQVKNVKTDWTGWEDVACGDTDTSCM